MSRTIPFDSIYNLSGSFLSANDIYPVLMLFCSSTTSFTEYNECKSLSFFVTDIYFAFFLLKGLSSQPSSRNSKTDASTSRVDAPESGEKALSTLKGSSGFFICRTGTLLQACLLPCSAFSSTRLLLSLS